MVSAQHSTSLSKAPLRIAVGAPAVSAARPCLGSLQDDEAAASDKVALPSGAVYVPKRLYSGFLEHLGRCIYGGIVNDPAEPSPQELLAPLEWKADPAADSALTLPGRLPLRIDVLHELAREMGVKRPLLRWPGGNYVSNYHWQDGIGPLSERPTRIELAWHSTETNLFGTDEFIEYCRLLGVEPYLCLNMGTGTLDEALAWLEYCNGTGNTHWANLRRKHTGRDAPHAIRFWGLGNEMWGEWQVGRMNADEYTRTAQRWAHALKLVDPSIVLVSCGKEGATEWDWTVLKGLTGAVDMHSIHYYSMLTHQKHVRSDEAANEPLGGGAFGAYEKNVFGAATAEAFIRTCARLIDLARIEHYFDRPLEGLREAVGGTGKAPIGICFDEWNVWDDHKATPQRGLEQRYDYTDMLGTIAWLHVLVRNADRVPIACLAQSVNVLSPLLTSGTTTLRQATYYPVSLFAEHMSHALLLQHTLALDVYEGPTFPAWVRDVSRPAYVDVVAVRSLATGAVHVSVLNRHPTAAWEAPLLLDDHTFASVEVHSMQSDDLAAVNTFEAPDVLTPHVATLSAAEWQQAQGVHAVPAHSWALFLFR
ncbi:glycoside hydrolase [Tilletiopsis washingtonensis]|uniref:non-reducing end alpha-L-arabinofuranosidase n=1 Tax=Tilletiopsis washingtonensis TaxID=58919 RepID=A0A316Z0E6_9BASI|nr:glycoside hydrolase [Tilletiopsis washingtonensis]PWN94989.1 glycoside hydrolase [Tilletiopsis washingtonensis]